MRLPHRLLTCCWLQPPEGTMHLNGMGIARGGDTSPRATALSTLLTHLVTHPATPNPACELQSAVH
eukprot:scaffold2013_cov138-Isochrysis_galbana.AAC.3